MKMHEALHSLVMARGKSVLESDSLADLLDHEHAFDSCPALKEAFEVFVQRGYAEDLYRSSLKGRLWYRERAYRIRKAMAEDRLCWQAFIDYSVDSVSYALGLSGPIPAPFEQGFRYSDGRFSEGMGIVICLTLLLPPAWKLIQTWQAESRIDWPFLLMDAFLLCGLAILIRERK